MVKERKNPAILLVLIILSSIILIAINAYLVAGTITAFSATTGGEQLGAVAFFVIGVIIFGCIGNAAAFIVALIGLIIAIVKNAKYNCLWQLITLIVLTVLPILLEVGFIVLYNLRF